MSRSVVEWIGKTDDSVPPPHVRLRIFRDRDGVCHLTKTKIKVGDEWDCDHVKALEDGGENRETNLAPAHRWAHRKKTGVENSRRAKADRTAERHLGIRSKPKGRPLTHPTLRRTFSGQVVPR